MNTKPYKYQVQDAQRIEDLDGRVLLANQMGLGKSLTCLLWLEAQPYVRPVVVVCPASLRVNWQREAKLHLGMGSLIVEGMAPLAAGQGKAPPMVILSYNVVGPTKNFPHGGWLEWLKCIEPQLVILDESHSLGSRNTTRTKNVRKLCAGVPYVIALSGTAFTNRPVELFPVLNILRPDLFPNYFGFASRYSNPRRTPWGWHFEGGRNLGELHQVLSDNVMIRRTKKDVLAELPGQKVHIVPVQLPEPGMKEYRHAERDFLGWLTKEAPHKVARAAKAERLVRMHYLRRLAGTLKLPVVSKWVKDFLLTGEKLIVFAIHKAVVKELKKCYPHCVTVTGETTKKKRQEAFDRFNGDSSCKLLVGNIDAAGVGWSASKGDTVLFAELAWNPGKHAQAADRVHGIGRGTGITASSFYLVARDTIETDLCDLIQVKQKDFSAAIDGREMAEDLNIFDMLEERLRKRVSL